MPVSTLFWVMRWKPSAFAIASRSIARGLREIESETDRLRPLQMDVPRYQRLEMFLRQQQNRRRSIQLGSIIGGENSGAGKGRRHVRSNRQCRGDRAGDRT